MAALDAGELAGAGLEIFTKEPLDPDSLLWLHPKSSNHAPYCSRYAPLYGPGCAGGCGISDATLPMSRCFMSRNADAEFLLLFYPLPILS